MGGVVSTQFGACPAPPPRRTPHTRIPWSPRCPLLSLSSRIPAPELRPQGEVRPGAPQLSGQAALCPAAQAPKCDWKSRACVSPRNYVSVEHRGAGRGPVPRGSPDHQDQAWAQGQAGHLCFCPGPPNTPSSSHGHVLTPQVLTAARSPPGKGRSLLCAVSRGAVLRVGTGGGSRCEQGAHLFLGTKPQSRSPTGCAGPRPAGKWRPHRGGSGLAVGPTPSFLETQDQSEKLQVGLEALSWGRTRKVACALHLPQGLGAEGYFPARPPAALSAAAVSPLSRAVHLVPGVDLLPGAMGLGSGRASSWDCPAGVSGPGPQPAPGPAHWDLPEGAGAPQGIAPGDGTPTWAQGAALREGPCPQHPEQTQGGEKAGSLLAGETTETLASHTQLIVRHLFHGRDERGGGARPKALRGGRCSPWGPSYVKAGSAMLWSGLQVKAMVTA